MAGKYHILTTIQLIFLQFTIEFIVTSKYFRDTLFGQQAWIFVVFTLDFKNIFKKNIYCFQNMHLRQLYSSDKSRQSTLPSQIRWLLCFLKIYIFIPDDIFHIKYTNILTYKYSRQVHNSSSVPSSQSLIISQRCSILTVCKIL